MPVTEDTAQQAAVAVGVVDPRPMVRHRVARTVAGDQRLTLVGSHASWDDVPEAQLPVAVWVSPSPRVDAAVCTVDVEDLDVDARDDLVARVAAAAHTGPTAATARQPARLSAREGAVLAALGAGEPAAETAAALGVSVKAVQNARRRAAAKLGVGTQVEAIRAAHELRVSGVDVHRAGDARR